MYGVGTIVQSTKFGDENDAKYQLSPVEGKPDWVALDVPPLMKMLFGDEDGEIRFPSGEISQRIAEGSIRVIDHR